MEERTYDQWAGTGRSHDISIERFKLKRVAFTTGDFSQEMYATSPLNTGGIGSDPPSEPNTWEYEHAQQTDLRIINLAREITTGGAALALPRQPQKLCEEEGRVIDDYFAGNLGVWNKYLLELQSRFGSVNVLGVVYYTREVGEIQTIDSVLRRLHKTYGTPRLEIEGVSTMSENARELRFLPQFRTEDTTIWVLRDSCGSLDYNAEFVAFPKLQLEQLAEDALKSRYNIAYLSTEGMHTVHIEKGCPGLDGYSGGPPETTSVPIKLILDLKERDYRFAVEFK